MRFWFRILLATTVLWLGSTPASYAHVFGIIPYQELFEKSDFIVIAKPVTKTTDTSERTYYSDLAQTDAKGVQSRVPAIGVETTFQVLAIIKGNSEIKQFVLHHYRDVPSPIPSFGGAGTVFFDPDAPKQSGEFLMFLLREKDGRYAPYGGQTDPDGRSVMGFCGFHD